LDSVPQVRAQQQCARTWSTSPPEFFGWEGGFNNRGIRNFRAGVAQLVEHLICNQRVGGSNPFASSIQKVLGGVEVSGKRVFTGAPMGSAGPVLCGIPQRGASFRGNRMSPDGCWCLERGSSGSGASGSHGQVWFVGAYAQVAEWLMAADCKSAAPWSYGGSNPPLCTRIERLLAAIAISDQFRHVHRN
jgi:hypothetical protein